MSETVPRSLDDLERALEAAHRREERYFIRIMTLRGLIQRIQAIDPADHATTSRDYGRGFSSALRLVLQEIDRDFPVNTAATSAGE